MAPGRGTGAFSLARIGISEEITMTVNAALFASPFVVFMGDIGDTVYGKTGLGLVQWRPEDCIGQVRLPGCTVDAGVPDLGVAAARRVGRPGDTAIITLDSPISSRPIRCTSADRKSVV